MEGEAMNKMKGETMNKMIIEENKRFKEMKEFKIIKNQIINLILAIMQIK